MKIVRYQHLSDAADEAPHVGLLRDDGVVNIVSAISALPAATPQQQMESLIDSFEALRPALEQILTDGPATPLDEVRLRPPLPRPSKMLNCIGNYWEHQQREPGQLNMFLKSPDSSSATATPWCCPTTRARTCSSTRRSWASSSRGRPRT